MPENTLPRDLFSGAHGAALLEESEPKCCHRRLVLEYLNSYWGDINIVHL